MTAMMGPIGFWEFIILGALCIVPVLAVGIVIVIILLSNKKNDD